MHASRPPIVRRRSRGYWRVKAVAGPNEILRRLEAVERGLAAVWRNSVPLIRDEVTPKTRRQMAEADREIRRGKVVPIHVSPRRIGKHQGGRVMAARRSSARADDLAQTLASIRRQLRRIPTDQRRRAELFTTLTYVARLYVRREIRRAPRPQTSEDTLRAAGIDDARQATYQRRLSTLLAGRAKAGA